MRRLPVQVAFALLMSLWLGVFVPGHQRHWVMLPGADAAEHGHHHDETEGERHHQHDDSKCAICLFAATMSVPPDVTPTLADLTFLDLQRAIEHDDLLDAELIPTFQGRAPPRSAGTVA